MPTFEPTAVFWRDWARLTPEERAAFLVMRDKLVDDLKAAGAARNSLRVREFASMPGWFEIRWSRDGRALFSFGEEKRPGEAHAIWHRVGTHAIYKGKR